MKDILSSIQDRRSYYSISKKSPISDDRIYKIVTEAVKHTPSSYNMQSQRVVLLLGPANDQLWNIVVESLRAIVPAAQFEMTEKKIKKLASSYGSILFYDDTAITNRFSNQFPLYREKFAVWSQHANAMLQINIWNLLEAEGFGASLQHYNPLIDADVQKAWNLPESWSLIAQMPFGTPTAAPDEKEFTPIEERVKFFK